MAANTSTGAMLTIDQPIHYCIDPGRMLPETAIIINDLWASRVGAFHWRAL